MSGRRTGLFDQRSGAAPTAAEMVGGQRKQPVEESPCRLVVIEVMGENAGGSRPLLCHHHALCGFGEEQIVSTVKDCAFKTLPESVVQPQENSVFSLVDQGPKRSFIELGEAIREELLGEDDNQGAEQEDDHDVPPMPPPQARNERPSAVPSFVPPFHQVHPAVVMMWMEMQRRYY